MLGDGVGGSGVGVRVGVGVGVGVGFGLVEEEFDELIFDGGGAVVDEDGSSVNEERVDVLKVLDLTSDEDFE